MDHLKELEEIKHVGIIPHLTDELARGLLGFGASIFAIMALTSDRAMSAGRNLLHRGSRCRVTSASACAHDLFFFLA
jgi:hypothetical protein